MTKENAVEMLALHYVSHPVFDALFGRQTSPLANALDFALDSLAKYGLVKELDGLAPFIREVELPAITFSDAELNFK